MCGQVKQIGAFVICICFQAFVYRLVLYHTTVPTAKSAQRHTYSNHKDDMVLRFGTE